MKWVEGVACAGERKDAYRVLWGDLRDRDCLEHTDVDGQMLLEWLLKKLKLDGPLDRSGSG